MLGTFKVTKAEWSLLSWSLQSKEPQNIGKTFKCLTEWFRDKSAEELRERRVEQVLESSRLEEKGLQLVLEECVRPSLVENRVRHSGKGTLADMGME